MKSIKCYIDQLLQAIETAGIPVSEAIHQNGKLHRFSTTGHVCSKYELYEVDKAIWSSQFPDATPPEYEQAMLESARVHEA